MNFFNYVLNYIFPPICGICGQISDDNLCLNCSLELNKTIQCRIDKYYDKKYFSEHLYLFKYEGIIRKKMLQYKFGDKPYLYNTFCEIFVKNKKVCGFLKKYDIIISVPMTKKKTSKRGYNQSELIAKKISEKIENLIFDNEVLIKVKDNKTQSSLNRTQRSNNVKGVYKVQNYERILNKNVLIFDDIYTTGSTVNECSKILKSSGAKNIGIITIAKD